MVGGFALFFELFCRSAPVVGLVLFGGIGDVQPLNSGEEVYTPTTGSSPDASWHLSQSQAVSLSANLVSTTFLPLP